MDHGTMNHPAKNESAASTEILYDKKEIIRDTIRVVLWDQVISVLKNSKNINQ
jgi:hypothetical protein